MAFPKRHHYLPEFYQARFTKNGYLWVYDRSQRAFRREQPKNTAVKRHYYSLEDEHRRKDSSLEKHLAWLDGEANCVIRKLEKGDQILPRERVLFSLWLGLLYCRTPSYERAVDELLTGHMRMLLLRNLRDPMASQHFTDPEQQLEYVASERFKLKASRNFTIPEMLRQGREIGRAFLTADWVIARAPTNTGFVTSDIPFGILAGPDQTQPVGVVSPEAVKAVPLSPRLCLLMIGNQAKFTTATLNPAEVRDVNLAVLRETETYAIARDKTLLRKLVKAAGLDNPKHRSKMVVKEFVHPSGDPMKSIAISYRSNS